ncbi:MAG TPA: exodeoxyribonuclease V subunit gamma [Chthoniobacterales bacterium]|nr:exodeoxyribonuclease V subunit gamma [Chthoniobacterales bacterium]
MPGLILHTSNQLDLLAQRLAQVVSKPLDSPFAPEIVVVQSLASRRWLSLKIAELQGICANYALPFLGDFIGQIVRQASPADARMEKMTQEALAWKLDAILPGCLGRKEFAPVAEYLRDGDSLKRFQLANRLANLFDQYRVYRPEMVAGWRASKKTRSDDEAWQSALWRQLGDVPGFNEALDRLRAGGFGDGQLDLPERVSIFAPASLPPAYLELLFQLARVRELHLFLLRPSREYRGDDRTPKQRARLGLHASEAAGGNPLVTSWGKIDADLTDLLLGMEERLNVAVGNGSETFKEFQPTTLLATLKSDILRGENRGAEPVQGDDPIPRVMVEAGDRSLVLHACHSPMREVEVLYDQLLDCFETIPNLQPRDIIVMTPEIEKYAPLIQAVFGNPEKDFLRIPYSLADRHPRSESLPIDTFLTLLELPGSRFTASQIFGLLGSRSIRRRFQFSDEDLSLIRDWIDDTAIRWGIDGEDRKRIGLPGLEANTWRHGLERLLLGYAMEGAGKDLFEGILPHDEVEGEGAEVLGRFISAAEAFFRLAETLERQRPLAAWVEPLAEVIEQFLEPAGEDELQDVRFLRFAVDQLRTLGDATGAEASIDFRVVRHHLAEQLQTMEQRGQFFTGGVTFCALKPVRSIPARVVCLLGINDQVFPRRPQPAQFDLMARSPRAGDPSARQDDRYSFLETLLSAGEKLSISYVGRSAVHNKEIPPSVVVNELLDYLNQAFAFPGKKPAREFVLIEHPLHAFSSRYFLSPRAENRLFSYSEANAEASRSITAARTPEMPLFIAGPLPQIEESKGSLELRELIEFWKNPARYFVKKRLGLSLWDRDDCLSDNEPFELDNLEKYRIRQELLADELETGDPLPPAVFQARGILPAGVIGELQLRSMRLEVQKVAEIVQGHIYEGKKDEPVDVDLQLKTFRLGGKIHSLYQGKSVLFRTAKLNAKDHLRAWIEHLVLCALAGNSKPETVLIGKDAVVTFGRVSSASAELQTLCELYWQGLTLPLRFFPTSGMAYVEAELSRRGDPFRKAGEKWEGMWRKNEKRQGERDDVFIARCFDPDSLDEDFAALARLVFGPMLRHTTREEL